MSDFDDFNLIEGLTKTSNYAVFVVVESSSDKLYRLTISQNLSFNDKLLETAKTQKKLSASGGFLDVEHIGYNSEGFLFYTEPLIPFSLANIIESKTFFSFEDVLYIYNATYKLLSDLNALGRAHGNILPTNIFLVKNRRGKGVKSFKVVLGCMATENATTLNDLRSLLKILYLLGTFGKSTAIVPNEPIREFISQSNVFSDSTFIDFFNKYIQNDNVDFSTLSRFVKEIKSLKKKSKTKSIVPVVALLSIMGLGYGVFDCYMSNRSVDKLYVNIEMNDQQINEIWKNYCRQYKDWFESFLAFEQTLKDDDFAKYYLKEKKHSTVLSFSDKSIDKLDPRETKLADVDMGIVEISNISAGLPENILRSDERKLFLINANRRLEKTRNLITNWNTFKTLIKLSNDFTKQGVVLKKLPTQNDVFNDKIADHIKNIEKTKILLSKCNDNFELLLSIQKRLSKKDDKFVNRFDDKFLLASISATANVDDFASLIENIKNKFIKIEKILSSREYKNADINLMLVENKNLLSDSLSIDLFDVWFDLLPAYEKIPSVEFDKNISKWNTLVDEQRKRLATLGIKNFKVISDINSAYESCVKEISIYSNIKRVKKEQKAIDESLQKIEISMSLLLSNCDKFIATQQRDLQERIEGWLKSIKTKKFGSNGVDNIWSEKANALIANKDVSSFKQSPADFFETQKKLEKFENALRAIINTKYLTDIELSPNLKDTNLKRILTEICSENKKDLTEKIIKCASELSLDKIDSENLLSLNSVKNIKKEYAVLLDEIQTFQKNYFATSSAINSINTKLEDLQNDLDICLSSGLLKNTTLNQSQWYKKYSTYLEFVRKVRNWGEQKTLLSLLNENSDKIHKQIVWLRVFEEKNFDNSALPFVDVYKQAETFLSALDGKNKSSFQSKIKDVYVEYLRTAKTPNSLLELCNYSKQVNVNLAKLSADISAKIFLAKQIFAIKTQIKWSIEDCRKKIDELIKSKEVKETKIGKILSEQRDILKENIAKNIGVSKAKVGPEKFGWTATDDKKKFTLSIAGKTHVLEFTDVELPNGDGYFLSNTEISAHLFFEWVKQSKLWENKVVAKLKEFDASESRSGIMVWNVAQNGNVYLRSKNDIWLKMPSPEWNDKRKTFEGFVDVPENLPMQYLSPEIALEFAKSLGCQLPTFEVWKKASDTEQDSQWNYRDLAYQKKSDEIEALIASNQTLGLYDVAIDADAFCKSIESNSNAKTINVSDNSIYIEDVNSRGKVFKHIRGNVAEYVLSNDGKYGVVGASAFSDTSVAPEKMLSLKNVDSANGFSDVGFRLMFKKIRVTPNARLCDELIKLFNN